ncbi:MAG: hypothetical protein H6704_23400 [Myxococcales bacterium]|nr:hypothetical protein [Myxococcales bacterium]MCB9539179.1 hypothetical protein [Myxococcales bacterium]
MTVFEMGDVVVDLNRDQRAGVVVDLRRDATPQVVMNLDFRSSPASMQSAVPGEQDLGGDPRRDRRW